MTAQLWMLPPFSMQTTLILVLSLVVGATPLFRRAFIALADVPKTVAQVVALSVGIGDHMGNLLSPFWVVVVAGIARVDVRTFFGYGVVFSLLWFTLGVSLLTFVP